MINRIEYGEDDRLYELSTSNGAEYKTEKSVIEVLQEISRKIEANMESIIGIYGKGTPEKDMPSAKINRNVGRQECIDIIDKYIAEYTGEDS